VDPVPVNQAPDGEADNETANEAVNEAEGMQEDPIGIMLLEDVKSVFAAKDVDRISSEDLCGTLAGMQDRPWPKKNRGRPITAVQLARLLRKFDIRPTTVWLPEKPLRSLFKSVRPL
jgi:hypothetical protein